MKARFPTTCECCKANIATGSHIVMLHGRPWITAHATAYQAKRRAIAAAGSAQK